VELPNDTTLVRVGSHRARAKLEQLLGTKPTCYFSFYHAGYLVTVPNALADAATKIKGIRRARVNLEEWHKCW